MVIFYSGNGLSAAGNESCDPEVAVPGASVMLTYEHIHQEKFQQHRRFRDMASRKQGEYDGDEDR